MLHLSNLTVVEVILMVEQKPPPLDFREGRNSLTEKFSLFRIKNQFLNTFGHSERPLIERFIPQISRFLVPPIGLLEVTVFALHLPKFYIERFRYLQIVKLALPIREANEICRFAIAPHLCPKRVDLIHERHTPVLLRKSWVRGLDLSPSSPWGRAILELLLKFLQFLFQYGYPLINGVRGQVDEYGNLIGGVPVHFQQCNLQGELVHRQ